MELDIKKKLQTLYEMRQVIPVLREGVTDSSLLKDFTISSLMLDMMFRKMCRTNGINLPPGALYEMRGGELYVT